MIADSAILRLVFRGIADLFSAANYDNSANHIDEIGVIGRLFISPIMESCVP